MFVSATQRGRSAGFSLIELVIVVVIIGIVGAIAIPRLSRGAEGAAASALAHDLATINGALELYAAEHGGQYPDEDDVVRQLTQQTYADGSAPGDPATQIVYGPYLREAPPAPVGPMEGHKGIATAHADGIGWIYNRGQQRITINLGGQDATDVLTPRQVVILNRYLNGN